jgi:hypothetical protein
LKLKPGPEPLDTKPWLERVITPESKAKANPRAIFSQEEILLTGIREITIKVFDEICK